MGSRFRGGIGVCALVLVLLPGRAAAQSGVVTGTVTELGSLRPLPTTSVEIVGTNLGGVTDARGVYRFTLSPGQYTVRVARLGYALETREVIVGAGQTATADFQLRERAITLDEISVTGYAVTARREPTGSQATVRGTDIQRMPIATADQAMQGRAAGVQVYAASGQPGSAPNIRIRGIGSISAGNSPLYIIDGVQIAADRQTGAQASTSPLASLNPRDIESIEILKDAAATSIYGAQAANGVVLISTRRGNQGKTVFTFNSEMGYSRSIDTWSLVDGPTWVRLQMEANANRAQDVGQTREQGEQTAMNLYGRPDQVQTYDWQGAILRDGALRKFNLSASGGTDDTRFFISGGVEDQEAQLLNSDFSRKTFRANLDHRATEKLSILTNIGLSTITQLGELVGTCANCAFAAAPYMRPITPIRNEDGTYNRNIQPLNYNIILQVENEDRQATTRQGIGNLTANYSILPRLNFRSLWGVDFRTRRERLYQPPEQQVIGDFGNELYREVINWSTNQVLNHSATLGGVHNLTSLAGFEYRDESHNIFGAQGRGFPSGLFRTLNLAANPTSVTGSTGGYKLASWFGRTQYDYLNRYTLSGSLRYDGSSRFGADRRYGLFYAISGAWNLAEEGFMQRFNVLDQFTLRAGYGVTGNAAIGDFGALTLFGAGGTYMGSPGLRPSQLGNDLLTWEQAKSLNLGFNWSMMSGRLSGAFDVFRTDNEDLLLDAFLPIDAGFSSVLQNAGVVRNRGVEIELAAIPWDGGRLGWRTDFNIAFLKNEIVSLVGDQQNIGNGIRVGHPRQIHWGVRWAGVNPADGRPMWYDADGNITYSPTTADQQVIGTNMPDITGGFNNSVRVGPVTIDAFLQYSLGIDLSDNQHASLMAIHQTRGLRSEVLDRWQQPGDITSIPKPYTSAAYPGTASWTTFSTRQLYDGGYVRLKHVTAAWEIPEAIGSRVGLGGGRMYVQGTNLHTWTKYPGLDPEVVESGATYPNATQFTLGLELRR